jgi:hypothetical protein
MKRREFLIAGLAAAASSAWPGARAFAAGSTVIASLPAVITEPGEYTLAASHTVSLAAGAAIDIRTDNVTIDLGGRTIANSAGVGTRAVGVYASDRIGIQVGPGGVALVGTLR